MIRVVTVVAVVLATAILSACTTRETITTPEAVVLITVDTLRADRLGAYGYRDGHTPVIDRLASSGALFSTVYCDIPWTTGSMASVMTGMYGPAHGLQMPWLRLPTSQTTLAEILRSEGFVTSAVIGNFTVSAIYGLDQGFDLYDDELSAPQVVYPHAKQIENVEVDLSAPFKNMQPNILRKMRNDAYRPDQDVAAAAITWLAKRPSGRFFLWVHFFGPHERIIVGQSDQRQRIIDDYDKDLTHTDAAVGLLLEALDREGLTDKTLVVFHSDHGQALAEHNIVGHGRDLHEATVRIPLMLRYPKVIGPGTRVEHIARNVDILPTILDYMHVAARPDLPGRSLRPVLEGRNDTNVPAFMELAVTPIVPVTIPGVGNFFAGTTVRSVRYGRWKYIATSMNPPCLGNPRSYSMGGLGINPMKAIGATPVPDEECKSYRGEALYDVQTDSPELSSETVNVAAAHPKIMERLRRYTEDIAANRGAAEHFTLSEDQEDKLRSLGYIE